MINNKTTSSASAFEKHLDMWEFLWFRTVFHLHWNMTSPQFHFPKRRAQALLFPTLQEMKPLVTLAETLWPSATQTWSWGRKRSGGLMKIHIFSPCCQASLRSLFLSTKNHFLKGHTWATVIRLLQAAADWQKYFTNTRNSMLFLLFFFRCGREKVQFSFTFLFPISVFSCWFGFCYRFIKPWNQFPLLSHNPSVLKPFPLWPIRELHGFAWWLLRVCVNVWLIG